METYETPDFDEPTNNQITTPDQAEALKPDDINTLPNPSLSTIKSRLNNFNLNSLNVDQSDSIAATFLPTKDKMYTTIQKNRYIFQDLSIDPFCRVEGKLNKCAIIQRIKQLMLESQELEILVDSLDDNSKPDEIAGKSSSYSSSSRELLDTLGCVKLALEGMAIKMVESTTSVSSASEASSNSLLNMQSIQEKLTSKTTKSQSHSIQPSITPSHTITSTTTQLQSDNQASKSTNNTLSSLESRLSSLESLIGTHHLSNPKSLPTTLSDHRPFLKSAFLIGSCGSVVEALSRLEFQTQLLCHPDHLPTTRERILAINKDIEKTIDLRKRMAFEETLYGNGPEDEDHNTVDGTTLKSNAQSRKIGECYKVCKELDGIAELVPSLLARLYALKNLHCEAAVFLEGMKEIECQLCLLTDQVKRIELDCSDLERSVIDNQALMIKNIQVLQGGAEG